jgi:hypothetical protein
MEEEIDLAYACANGDVAAVNRCIELGYYIHARDQYALRTAVLNGHIEIVQLLVSNGANIYGLHGRPVIMAFMYRHTQIFEFLLSVMLKDKSPNEETIRIRDKCLKGAFIEWAGRGELSMIKLLVRAGMDPAMRAFEVLRRAAGCNRWRVVRYSLVRYIMGLLDERMLLDLKMLLGRKSDVMRWIQKKPSLIKGINEAMDPYIDFMVDLWEMQHVTARTIFNTDNKNTDHKNTDHKNTDHKNTDHKNHDNEKTDHKNHDQKPAVFLPEVLDDRIIDFLVDECTGVGFKHLKRILYKWWWETFLQKNPPSENPSVMELI